MADKNKTFSFGTGFGTPATSAATNSTFSFGAASANKPATTGFGSGFGASGGLFGSQQPATTTTTSLFGSTSTPAPTSSKCFNINFEFFFYNCYL